MSNNEKPLKERESNETDINFLSLILKKESIREVADKEESDNSDLQSSASDLKLPYHEVKGGNE